MVAKTAGTASDHQPVNAMTVDVEDYFQVSAFEPYIPRQAWDRLPCRVESNTDRILALFAGHGIKATFFTLGWVARRYPGLVRRIVEDGHELACHGLSHVRVTEQTPEEFREDVRVSKCILEDISGQPVLGYRAASYSIGAKNLWAFPILEELGFQYSSSIYPVRHDLYGMPEAPRFAFHPTDSSGGLLELPVTTVKLGRHNYPCGGGGYFRLLPYPLSRWAMRRVNRTDRESCIFYFHPWEIDPDQPRQSGISLKTRFRHYLNLSKMEIRLTALLRDFAWDTMANVFLPKAKIHSAAR
ncbi:XrtA system polysaccharide deacetylase [Methylomagnum ishizawai]|uniref:XrtA system polysaccharide deacetylase n=1 Tax=Methylomagnum ishizawai TaxID=1760988 RepID=UPI001FEAE849|nr:XrtA system polysaccharide deacetylase [Methylomagnum ishizawai]